MRCAAVALGITLVTLLGVCGGKSKSENAPSPSASTTDKNGAGVATESTVAKAKCETTPGKQKARIRFVNVYTNKTYPKSDIDIWQGLSATDPCAKKLTTVPFGQASDYIDITPSNEAGDWSAAAYVAGATDRSHEIVVRGGNLAGWRAGDDGGRGRRAARRRSRQRGPGPDVPRGEQRSANPRCSFRLRARPHSASRARCRPSSKTASWFAGVGKSTCLRSLSDTASHRTTIGGTQVVRYSVDPGSLDVAVLPEQTRHVYRPARHRSGESRRHTRVGNVCVCVRRRSEASRSPCSPNCAITSSSRSRQSRLLLPAVCTRRAMDGLAFSLSG